VCYCIPGQSRGYFGFGPGSLNPPPSQDTFCPEAIANSFCLFLFKLCILVGWVMDWKSADFHNGRVIFERVGGKKHPFFSIFNTFSYIELTQMFQISYFFLGICALKLISSYLKP
jgi:hypothetical protein